MSDGGPTCFHRLRCGGSGCRRSGQGDSYVNTFCCYTFVGEFQGESQMSSLLPSPFAVSVSGLGKLEETRMSVMLR